MPRHNKLNEVRRSQVLGYGPGAIVDFRVGDLGAGTISGCNGWPRPNGMKLPDLKECCTLNP